MDDDGPDYRQASQSEYAAWCAEQEDDDEINRMFDEAANDDR